jgi:hypothetical protein
MHSKKRTNVSNPLSYLFEVYKQPFPSINMTPVTEIEIKDIMKMEEF